MKIFIKYKNLQTNLKNSNLILNQNKKLNLIIPQVHQKCLIIKEIKNLINIVF